MNITVLGGTGFLGYHIVHALLKQGHRVKILALPPLPVENLFPDTVTIQLVNVDQLTDDEYKACFSGQDAVVFAAGLDDRYTPKKPSYPAFYKANVIGTKRFLQAAKSAGVQKAVVLGSYFTWFDRIWPELKIAENHPYVKSRKEQLSTALSFDSGQFAVSVLELGYIFGNIPGRKPIWKPVIDYVRSPLPLIFMQGGTNMIAVEDVALAVAYSLEKDQMGKAIPVCGKNLTWDTWLESLAGLLGKKGKVLHLPNWLVKFFTHFVVWYHSLLGKESGLDPVKYVDLQTRNTWLFPDEENEMLVFEETNLQGAFKDTIQACLKSADKIE